VPEHNVVAGTDASRGDVEAKLEDGYRLLSVGWDTVLLQQKLTENLGSIRSAMATAETTVARRDR
jgi:hypothetical protein